MLKQNWHSFPTLWIFLISEISEECTRGHLFPKFCTKFSKFTKQNFHFLPVWQFSKREIQIHSELNFDRNICDGDHSEYDEAASNVHT